MTSKGVLPAPVVRVDIAEKVNYAVKGSFLLGFLEALLPVADKFPDDWVIPYNLACYTAQLGRMEEAEQWLKLSFVKGDKEAKQAANDAPDLVPLWEGQRGTKWKKAD